MKKLIALLLMSLMLVTCVALAEGDDVVYGTMNIPYDAFYAGEGVAFDVDAVSSATNSKWKNPGLVAGTYYAEHADDDGGDILGVVYPVAISQADLDALGDDNYGFEALEAAPAAYKPASLIDGKLVFAQVEGDASILEAEASLTTESKYGDYQINVTAINNSDGTSDIGTIYGVMLSDNAGNMYALRHLENIWRDNLAFSAGFKTVESHGNTIKAENYADMMGNTIGSITYITDTGYHTLLTDLYVPVKFDGGAAVADAVAADGQTTVTLTGIPEDYALTYSVAGLDVAVNDGVMTYADALPGSYTLTVSDENGVYADLLTSFTLTTDELPVAYDADNAAIVAAEGADEALANTFIKNIATVTVGETTYNATGKGAVAVVTPEGTVDTEAAVTSGKGADAVTTPIFGETGSYELTVSSTGFTQALTFTVDIEK